MANNKISFKRGLKSQYDATSKDGDTLYFVKETESSKEGELYLGDILITKHISGASFNRTTKNLTITFNNGTSTDVNLNDVMVTVTAATTDNIATFGSSGQVKDSQKTIGGSTLGPTPNENTLATEKAVENAINASLSSVYIVRGSATAADINALTSNQVKIGYVYDVSGSGTISGHDVEDGDNVVCISIDGGTGGVPEWDKLAASVDLSNYIQKVASPTEHDIATLDSVGGIADSNVSITNTPSPTPSSSKVPTENLVNTMISTVGDTKYVRYDINNQNLNSTQKANARTNIDVIQKIQNAIGNKLVISTSGGEISERYSVESSQTTGADNTKIPTIGKVNDMVQNASVQWEQLES